MALNIRFKGKTKVNERGECVDCLICSEEFPDCFERGGGGGVTRMPGKSYEVYVQKGTPLWKVKVKCVNYHQLLQKNVSLYSFSVTLKSIHICLFKVVTNILFSHVGLFILVIGYCAGG